MSVFTRRQMLGAIARPRRAERRFSRTHAAFGRREPQVARFWFRGGYDRARELAPRRSRIPGAAARGFDKLDYDNGATSASEGSRSSRETAAPSGWRPFISASLSARGHDQYDSRRAGLANSYSPALFDYGRVKPPKDPPVISASPASGCIFRSTIRCIRRGDLLLGASYFRFLGREQQYACRRAASASKRARTRKAFRFFANSGSRRPRRAASRATIYALLDGRPRPAPSIWTDAGHESVLDVRATLFRAGEREIRLAPLTSMYLTGENDHRIQDAFAPSCTIRTGC